MHANNLLKLDRESTSDGMEYETALCFVFILEYIYIDNLI